jgi:hypothetical protein
MTNDTATSKAATTIAAWMNRLGLDVYKFADKAGALWTGRPNPLNVAQKDILSLENMSKEFLGNHSFAVGAGVIFSAEAIENSGGVLEWWTTRAQGIEKLEFDLTPGGERFYDYQNMPFFTSAGKTGEQSVWGPYVDYLGLDEYILTHTAPIRLSGQFVGVAGYDIRIRQLEEIFMPALRAIPGDAALLNESRRVVVGNSGAYLVGERIRSIPNDKQLIPIEAPHLGLSLLSHR